eukprot:INCI19140.1.p1 GENE.INCI19140.1~~INCI19140.1.p1  ORF type:complete len:143 (-),score=19.57 INCI19140.1:59-487(-)
MGCDVLQFAKQHERESNSGSIPKKRDSLLAPAFFEDSALEQRSRDPHHSNTPPGVSQRDFSAASSGAFRFTGQFDVFTSEDDDEVQLFPAPAMECMADTMRLLWNLTATLLCRRNNSCQALLAIPRSSISTVNETRYIFRVF